jgi:hypothetical protein
MHHKNARMLLLAMGMIALVGMPEVAWAGPFDSAIEAACQFQRSLRQLALAVGMIGIISCLLLGYFNKMDFKWLATGIGVSYALPLVTSVIQWLSGGGC